MQALEQNSITLLSSLKGAEGKVCVPITCNKNHKSFKGVEVTDVISLSLLFPALPLPLINRKGADMSCFKDGDKWRWNEPSKTIQYFKCRLKEYVKRSGLNVSELARLLNKSIPSVSGWINGQSIPPSDIQEMIAQIVGAKSRAEIWIYKGADITKYRIHLNKLRQEEEKIKQLIQRQLAGAI